MPRRKFLLNWIPVSIGACSCGREGRLYHSLEAAQSGKIAVLPAKCGFCVEEIDALTRQYRSEQGLSCGRCNNTEDLIAIPFPPSGNITTVCPSCRDWAATLMRFDKFPCAECGGIIYAVEVSKDNGGEGIAECIACYKTYEAKPKKQEC